MISSPKETIELSSASIPDGRGYNRTPALLLTLAAALSVAFFLTRLFSPWHWVYDVDNSAIHAYIGMNYVREGLFAHRGGMHTWTNFDGPRAAPDFYNTHPPLLAMLCALAQWLGGFRPFAVRFVPGLAQLASVLLLFQIGRRLFDANIAAWGALFYAALPMTAYFGFIVNFEPLVNCFVLAAVNLWLHINDKGWSTTRAAALSIVLLVSMWTDWPAYFLAGGIGLDWLIAGRGRSRLRCLLPWGLGLASFALYVGFVHQLGASHDDDANSLWSSFLYRANISAGPAFSIVDFYKFLRKFSLFLFGIGLIPLAYGAFRFSDGRFARTFYLLAAMAGLNVVVFSNGAYMHEFWTFYFSAPAALGAMALMSRWRSGRLAMPARSFAVLALAAQSVWVIAEYNVPDYKSWADGCTQIGKIIHTQAKPGDILMMPSNWGDGAATAYSAQLPLTPVYTIEDLNHVRNHPDFHGGYLVELWKLDLSGSEALMATFPSVGEVEMSDSKIKIVYVPRPK